MHRIILTAVLLVSAVFQSGAQQISLFDKLVYVNKGDTLPYRLLKPVNPGAKEEFPLVIFLHGIGERGNDNEVQIKHISELFVETRNRGKYPCYVLAPQCPKKQMWANFDGKGENVSLRPKPSEAVDMLMELIDQVSKEFPIDQSRIYITGLSMGGYGTWDMIARYPNKFAAAIPICGGGAPNTAGDIKQIPIWAFHGALDRTVPPQESRKMISALQKAGALPGYTEYPDIEHNSWIHAYKEPHLIHWLFKQKLGTPTSKKSN
jgi:predicted peptidase